MKLDRQRKGVIRAIYRWLELRGVTNASMDYVKAIACRAAKADSFNRISPDALTRVYAEFCHKQESPIRTRCHRTTAACATAIMPTSTMALPTTRVLYTRITATRTAGK